MLHEEPEQVGIKGHSTNNTTGSAHDIGGWKPKSRGIAATTH